jgi:hypothetical protein
MRGMKYSNTCCLQLPWVHLEVMVLLLSSSIHCFLPVSGTEVEAYCKLTSLDGSTSKETLLSKTNKIIFFILIIVIILLRQPQ